MSPSKILVVDDEIELERLIRQRFRKKIMANEIDFIFVHNGLEALEKLKGDSHIDMILTDINMPGMDGLTLLKEIAEMENPLKTVVVSAYGDLPNIRTAMNRGAFDFITKPIDFQDLAITIDKTLDFVQKSKQQKDQLQKALEQLRYQAFYDQLTCLPNQNLMIGRIRQCLEWWDKNSSKFAVLFISLDGLKNVKYGLGHSFSDILLIEIAQRLENMLNPTDTVARVGVDEFAILLSDLSNFEHAQKQAELIHHQLRIPMKLNGSFLSCNSYIGMVYSSINYEHPEDFLRAADMAMHYAKKEGKSPILFEISMQTRTLTRLQLEADLQEALETQQFVLNYQPIISLETGKVVSFEALLRWKHPQRGLIPPSDFIPVAEETGLIIPIGKWVLLEACRFLQNCQNTYPDHSLTISVNLSGVQLSDPELLNYLDQVLQSFSLKGSSVKLEITETILMERGEETLTFMAQLKERQIELSIDDFGTGYSSLAYLQSFPIDTLKIDRSFVNGLVNKDKNLDITQTIITLAHALGLDVISEGVETQEQLEILQTLGCEYAQGFFFSKPLPETEIARFIECH